MDRKFFEAEVHRRIKRFLWASDQGRVMGEVRAVLDEMEAQQAARHQDVKNHIEETSRRVYGSGERDE